MERVLSKPSRELIIIAQRLRQKATSGEALLWELLRGKRLHGRKFRRQHPIGRFVADFFCDDARLIIEIDGSIHHEQSQRERDLERETILRQFSLSFLRFSNDLVLQQPEEVLEQISNFILTHSYQNSPLSHSVGEGGRGGEGLHFAPVTIRTPDHLYEEMEMRMGGLYQRTNAACAVAAAELALKAQGKNLPESATRKGLAETSLPGRLTTVRLNDGPLVVLDGAHNALAAQALASPIRLLRDQERLSRLFLVIGMVGGHSPEGVLEALAPGAERLFACQPDWKRAQPAETIAEAAQKWISSVEVIPSVEQATRSALRAADPETMVLITGSFYTVGEVPVETLEIWRR